MIFIQIDLTYKKRELNIHKDRFQYFKIERLISIKIDLNIQNRQINIRRDIFKCSKRRFNIVLMQG